MATIRDMVRKQIETAANAVKMKKVKGPAGVSSSFKIQGLDASQAKMLESGLQRELKGYEFGDNVSSDPNDFEVYVNLGDKSVAEADAALEKAIKKLLKNKVEKASVETAANAVAEKIAKALTKKLKGVLEDFTVVPLSSVGKTNQGDTIYKVSVKSKDANLKKVMQRRGKYDVPGYRVLTTNFGSGRNVGLGFIEEKASGKSAAKKPADKPLRLRSGSLSKSLKNSAKRQRAEDKERSEKRVSGAHKAISAGKTPKGINKLKAFMKENDIDLKTLKAFVKALTPTK